MMNITINRCYFGSKALFLKWNLKLVKLRAGRTNARRCMEKQSLYQQVDNSGGLLRRLKGCVLQISNATNHTLPQHVASIVYVLSIKVASSRVAAFN